MRIVWDFKATQPNLIISPENSRVSTRDIHRQKPGRNCSYTIPISATIRMIRLLKERAKANVRVRILGKLEEEVARRSCRSQSRSRDRRLHVRVNRRVTASRGVRRKPKTSELELDGRREIGIIVREPKLVKRLAATFEADWAKTPSGEER